MVSERIKHVFVALVLHWTVLFIGILTPLSHPVSQLSMTHSFADHFIQWDSQWFVNIARYGYVFPVSAQIPFVTTGNAIPFFPPYKPAAFFPGLPMCVHLLTPIGALGFVNAMFILALWMMHIVVGQEKRGMAFFAVLLFAVNPCAIFFSSLYTETFTVLAALLICFGLRQTSSAPHYAVTCLGAFMATSVHDLGAFSILYTIRFIRLRQPMRALGYIFVTLLPPAAYELYLVCQYNTPLALLAAEASWNRSWRPPFVNLIHTVASGAFSLNTCFVLGLVLIIAWQIGTCFRADHTWFIRPRAHPPVIYSLETGLWMTCILLLGLCAYIPKYPLMSVLRFFCVVWPAYIPTYVQSESASRDHLPYPLHVVGGTFLAYATVGTALFTHGWFFQ